MKNFKFIIPVLYFVLVIVIFIEYVFSESMELTIPAGDYWYKNIS